jgi:hypothetical protein
VSTPVISAEAMAGNEKIATTFRMTDVEQETCPFR